MVRCIRANRLALTTHFPFEFSFKLFPSYFSLYQYVSRRFFSAEANLAPLTAIDDMVLVQLGEAPEDVSQQEYGSGLQQVIQHLRNKKVKDFNTVASEITAYRAQFLRDSSKVLPL